MIEKTEKTYWAKIYSSGPISVAEHFIRKEAWNVGMCATIEPTKFIYTGGEEAGFVIGLINYPRFPTEEIDILEKARNLAIKIMEETCQASILIMCPDKTVWISRDKIR